jgi:hypothetical protein
MEEFLYSIKDETGNIVAQHMRLDSALTLVDALFNKYYSEPKIGYTIIREAEIKEEVK